MMLTLVLLTTLFGKSLSQCAIAEHWTTEPWNFGGTDQGNVWGEGLIPKGCLTPTSESMAANKIELNTQSGDHQAMVGFGAALSESSAFLIQNHPKKDEVICIVFSNFECVKILIIIRF